jgi:hypothetical protein
MPAKSGLLDVNASFLFSPGAFPKAPPPKKKPHTHTQNTTNYTEAYRKLLCYDNYSHAIQTPTTAKTLTFDMDMSYARMVLL